MAYLLFSYPVFIVIICFPLLYLNFTACTHKYGGKEAYICPFARDMSQSTQ